MRKRFLTIAVAMMTLVAVNTYEVTANEYFKAVKSNVVLKLNGEFLDTKDSKGKSIDILNVNGNTYVPLRFLSESAGLDVSFDPDTSVVDINSTEERGLSSALQSTSLDEIQNKINELANISELNEAISSYLMTLESQGMYIENLNINGVSIKPTPADMEKAIITIAEKEIQLETLTVRAGSKTRVIDLTLKQR